MGRTIVEQLGAVSILNYEFCEEKGVGSMIYRGDRYILIRYLCEGEETNLGVEGSRRTSTR